MSKALTSSRIALKVAYLALSTLIILLAVLYFARLQASAATPQVTFERDGGSVTATATPTGSDELKFLRNADSEQYWAWDIVADDDDCNANDFIASREALRVTDANSATLVVAASAAEVAADQNLCLKVLYGSGSANAQQFREAYVSYLFDVTAPEIDVTQAALALTARSMDSSGIQSWSSYNSATILTTCDESVDGNIVYVAENPLSGNNHYTLALTTAQDNYYCFKAQDGQGNTGHSEPLQVDTSAPQLSVDQPDESAMVTVTIDANPGTADIDVDSWQYVQTTQACTTAGNWRDLDVLTDDLNDERAVVSFSRSIVGRTYCFRVADEAGNYAHVQHQVASINEPPVVNRPSQNRQTVTVTATDRQYLNNSSWQYTVTSSQDCHGGLTGWQDTSSTGFSSDSQRNKASLDLTEVEINEDTQNKWLCFRVSDNVADNWGYRALDVDSSQPTINVRQDNSVLRASAPSADQAISSTWRYVRHTSSFDCDEDAFEIYTPIRSGTTVNLTSNDIGDYFCFRVADRHDNFGYSTPYRVRSLDTAAPKISATQDNKYLTLFAAASENVDNDTWGVAPGYSKQPDCEEIDSYLYDEVEERTVELDERDTGDWFCIRAADESDNYGYYSLRIKAVDATAPRVEVDRVENTLKASTTAEDVDKNSWQYAVSDANDRFDCDDLNRDLDFNTADDENDRVALSESDNDKYFCFRVADKAGNYGYDRSDQVYDVEPAPILTITQLTAEKRLEILTDATDVDGLTWGWAVFSSDPGDCSSVRFTEISHNQITRNTRRIFVNNIADTQDGHYYCFRVADTSSVYGTNYGYGKHRYDLTAPTIKFAFANNVLTVSSDDDDVDATTWYYAKFTSVVDCSSVEINSALPYRKVSLTAADNGSYFCFRVADKVKNVAYARYAVNNIDDDSIPKIDILQTKLVIIASSADRDIDTQSWRYALTVDEPYCGLDHGLSLVKNSGALYKVDLSKVSNNYNWVCFQVADKADNKGFAKIEIDRTAPTILIKQNNVTLVVSSADEDLDTHSWAYVKSDDDLNCKSADFNKLDFSSQEIAFDLTVADSNKYFCFKVSDKVGNDAFKKTRIAPMDMSAPVIKLSQTNNVLSASATNVDDDSWQYARSRNDLNCSKTGKLSFSAASATNKRLTISASDNGYWYCFKVKGSNATDGYAKILVNSIDTRAPKVEVVQSDDVILATADESGVTWHYVILTSAADECLVAAFGAMAHIEKGNQVTLSANDNGLVYCFRATDAAGNAGFDSVKVDIDVDSDDDDGSGTPGTEDPDDDKTTTGDGTTKDDDDDEEGIFGENTNWLITGAAVVVLLIAIVAIIFWIVKGKDKDMDNSDDVEYM